MAKDAWKGRLHSLSADGMRDGEVEGSEATVSQSEDGIEYSVMTSGLTPGNAYTLWVMAFNNPATCSDPNAPPGFRCGGADMENADAGFALMWGGAGAFAEGESATFEGRRAKGDMSGVELDTPGLTNPAEAEIHFRVRDHGPRQPGLEDEQITTLQGGCTEESMPPGGTGKRGTYLCRDVQATGI